MVVVMVDIAVIGVGGSGGQRGCQRLPLKFDPAGEMVGIPAKCEIRLMVES